MPSPGDVRVCKLLEYLSDDITIVFMDLANCKFFTSDSSRMPQYTGERRRIVESLSDDGIVYVRFSIMEKHGSQTDANEFGKYPAKHDIDWVGVFKYELVA